MIPNKLHIAVSNADSATPADLRDANHGSNGMSRQRWAFICVAIAWIVGTLLFEMTAHGNESSPFAQSPDEIRASFVEQMQTQHAVREIVTSDMEQMLRLAGNAKLLAKCDAVIASAGKQNASKKPGLNATKSAVAHSTQKPSSTNQNESPLPVSSVADSKSIVPDSMMVDPVLDVMPVSKWITQVAYQALDNGSLPFGLKSVSQRRLALDQARTSALPGLMRLLVSANRKSAQAHAKATGANQFGSSLGAKTKIRTVSAATSSTNAVANAGGLSSRLVPTFAEQMPAVSSPETKQDLMDVVVAPLPPNHRKIFATKKQTTKAELPAKTKATDAPTEATVQVAKKPKPTTAKAVELVVKEPAKAPVATSQPAPSQNQLASDSIPRPHRPQTTNKNPIVQQQTTVVDRAAVRNTTQVPSDPTTVLRSPEPTSLKSPNQTTAQTVVRAPAAATPPPSVPALATTIPVVDSENATINPPATIAATEQLRIAQWPFKKSTPANSNAANVSLNVQNTDVRSVLEMLSRGYGMNILIAPSVEGVVTANIDGMNPDQTLHSILKLCNLRAQVDGEAIFIYPASAMPDDSREVRHFTLDYARAETVEPAIQGLLSQVGNAYVNKMEATDNLRTSEAIVVVDTPDSIERIAGYLMQVDQPPRQVMIEARILEVELTDDMFHGVDLSALVRGDLAVKSFGLADPIASSINPLFYAQIDGARIKSVIEFLETTTDAKTLATPKIMVVNGQNARIQVGQQLGFTVATVTQTSTVQDVQFLDTGVVLSVTPTIGHDNRIMMQVKPEVSNGQINPDTLLPEEETRELETSVLLNDHQGVVIGGLIQENDRTVIKKLPWLGDVKHVGKLFQRREAVRSRSEIIIALVPHIIQMDEHPDQDCFDHEDWHTQYDRTKGPLLYGPLQRSCRPWEPRLPDSAADHNHLDVDQINQVLP